LVSYRKGEIAEVFLDGKLVKKWSLNMSPIKEDISPAEVKELQRYVNTRFASLGLDIHFGYHFLERVNDIRNKKPISIGELTRLFRKELTMYGEEIAAMPDGTQAVLKDLATKINLPFVLDSNDGDDDIDMFAKSIMRNPNFATSNQTFEITEHELPHDL
jgi:hypothetical protein